MGVSISYISKSGKEVDITPGLRSMMIELLDRYFGRKLYADDIQELEEIAETQFRDERESGFDWTQDIHDNILKITKEIKKSGWVILLKEY